MTDKRAHLSEINRDWGWWTPEARNGARVWMTVQLESAWAEVERLKQEHDYEIIAIDDARKAAEKRVKVLEEALNSMVRVASRGHVPDDVFDAMARIRSAAMEETRKEEERG